MKNANTKIKNYLNKVDTFIDKYVDKRVRLVIILSILFSFPLISFIDAPTIFLNEITVGIDTSIFYDRKFAAISLDQINLDMIAVESDFSVKRNSDFFNIKPKRTIKKVNGVEKEVLPLVDPITHKKINVSLGDISETLLNKAYVSPPNGYFTNTQWKKLSNEERQKYMDAFIIKYWKSVHEEYLATGVHPLIILVKGIDETRYGTSKLFYDSKNWGAIKYTLVSQQIHRGIFKKNKFVYADDDCGSKACMFFKFDSVWEGKRAFSLFVKKDRYTKHLKNRKDVSKNTPTDWCNALTKGGYSTSNNKGKFARMSKEVLEKAKDLGLPLYLTNYGV